MEFRILGPLEARNELGAIPLGGIKPRSILAMLLLHANEPVSAERLALGLWGEEISGSAVDRLYVHVARLRKALGDPQLITTTSAGYCLRVRPGELDAARLVELVDHGRRELAERRPQRAATLLREALSLSRGPPLADLTYEPFAANEIARLEELQFEALEARVEADLAAGRHGSLVSELQQLVRGYPKRERLAEHLMLALYRCGRQTEALETYRDVRRVLITEFGVEPSPALRRMHDCVLQQDAAIAPRDVTELQGERSGAAPVAHRPRRVRFNLPLAAAHFAGRSAELGAIDEALGIADRTVVAQAITGVGGVGKSLLTAHYVQQHLHEYDIVAWIRAEDGGVADLSELSAALGLPVTPMTPGERADAAVRWLGGCDERWLLVLDNLAAPEQLRDCCPAPGNGRVIVTTRDCGISQFGPVLRVDVFDEQTSVEYLLARAGRGGDRDGAMRLARALGGLPLALSHAGAYCAAGTSFDDYLELLQALPAADLFDSHPEVSYAQTVASTWQASMLVAEREAPLARQVLAMAAYLAPDAIPRELFEVLLDDVTDAATRKRLMDAFNALHRLSLAEVRDTDVSVHRLLQKTIRDDPDLSVDETGHVNALAAVAAAFPDNHDQPQTWPQSERLLPHVIAIAATRGTLGAAGQQLVTLLNTASDYVLRADPGARAIDTATRASTCAQRILGPEHPETLRAQANLAGAYREAGRITEAIELGERVLADRERILGGEHHKTLSARVILAVSYREAGRSSEAIELGEQVVADYQRILGLRHPGTLRACGSLVVSYREAGRIPEAIELGERVVADRKSVLGAEHPGTLRARGSLAASYREAGRITEAIELGERVLADCRRILGSEHHNSLTAGMILGFCYVDAGRTTDAFELGQSVVADSQRVLGSEHPTTLSAGVIVAGSYRNAGRIAEAIELGERVLADSERVLGFDHPSTLRARGSLAMSYEHAGRITEAIDLRERVLAEQRAGPSADVL